MIHAIIVDDETYCRQVLATLLKKHCPEVQLVASCPSAEEGIKQIRQHQPQLVFLDIEMPQMNGFDMLEKLQDVDFHLIFTTSYDQYAIKAFRFSALDYLLKPIDREELQRAVQKVVKQHQKPVSSQLELLFHKLNPSMVVNKIALPTMEGLQMVTVNCIVRCQSDSNYTIIHLKDKQKLVVARTLKEIEEMLEDYPFARVHHSSLVNLNEIQKYVKGDGGYLIMSDGTHIDVSRTKKESLLKKLLNTKD